MVPLIARAASPQALLSLRYIEGTCFRIRSPRNACGEEDKVMAGGTPANPAAMAGRSAAQETRDQHSLDFGCSLADLVDFDVTPVPGDGVVLHEAVPTVDLHRLVGGTF
jgi:hypothetical protein